MSGVSSGSELRLNSAAEAGLSPNARLYVATGSPLLYRRVGRTEQLQFDASWLYVPGAMIHQPDNVRSQAVTDVALGHAIDLEDWTAYPLEAGGETVGLVVLPRDEQPELDQNRLVSLTGSLSPEIEKDQRLRPPVSELFIQHLFQRDGSPQQFTKRLLSLLSLEWPGSCAGAYVEHQGVHHLLLAIGEVSRYYRHTRQLSLDRGAEFAAACANKEPFLPAELLPDQATFLTTAPDLFYVHQGWRSERLSQYVAIVGPGDLSRRTSRRLHELCALTASLQESQFHTAAELLDGYRALSRTKPGSDEFNTIMLDTADQMGQQMQLSRVVLARFDDKQSGGKVRVILTHPAERSTIEERERLDTPEPTLEKVRAGHSELIPDLTSCGLDDAQARRRYLDNVASEYCMPVTTSRGVVGIAAFGSSVAGDYLTKTAPTLSAVTGMVSVWSAMQEPPESPKKDSAIPDTAGPTLEGRLTAIRRLTEGYMHGLSESVSAAIGQAELLRNARRLDDPIIEAQRQTAAAETLCAVADKLDLHLSGLRQVFALTTGPSDSVDGGEAVAAIPAMLGGLLQQMKGSKNIDLQIATDIGAGMLVAARDIYDNLVPLVTAIVEQSICSGQITVGARSSEHTVTFSVRFRQRLLGGLELPRLLTELYPWCELILQDTGTGQMIIGDSTLVFHPGDTDEYVVTMDCIRRSSENTTTVAANPSNRRSD